MRDSRKNTSDDVVEELLELLNTFGHTHIAKKDLYNYLMGDKRALEKYQGDKEPDISDLLRASDDLYEADLFCGKD